VFDESSRDKHDLHIRPARGSVAGVQERAMYQALYQVKTNNGTLLCYNFPGSAYETLQALQARAKPRAASDKVDQP